LYHGDPPVLVDVCCYHARGSNTVFFLVVKQKKRESNITGVMLLSLFAYAETGHTQTLYETKNMHDEKTFHCF
jgi:hypothetical protein